MDFPNNFDIWSLDLSFPVEPVGNEELASFERQFPPWEYVGQTRYGNFCEIYQARPRGRDVPASYAAKVLKTEWCNTEIGTEIMSREVEVGRKISHPHLVPVLDSDLESVVPYLIQPWLSGKTVKEYLLSGKRAKISEILWIARQVAEALVAMEDAGYCHADIKPGNIHLSEEGHATLIDLGMSHHLEKSENSLDRSISGTPRYMAPELVTRRSSPTMKSDIFALGNVIREMISKGGFHQTPKAVQELIERMTAPDTADRPASAAAMLRELLDVEIRFYRNS